MHLAIYTPRETGDSGLSSINTSNDDLTTAVDENTDKNMLFTSDYAMGLKTLLGSALQSKSFLNENFTINWTVHKMIENQGKSSGRNSYMKYTQIRSKKNYYYLGWLKGTT
jgi:hypothetical protein